MTSRAFFRAARAVRLDQWGTPAAAFLGSRLALFALILFFLGLFPVAPQLQANLAERMTVWDGEWYLEIVSHGYSWNGPEWQSSVAFFPLYPFLGRLAGQLLGGGELGLFVVANLSFAVYLFYLHRLVCLDVDRPAADRTVLYLAIFPLSFIFSSPYAEATMLALATASFYYGRRGRWSAAVLLGFLAALTRLAGVLILLPLLYEFLQQRGLSWRALGLALVPGGTAGFIAYQSLFTGSPLGVVRMTSASWSRHFSMPWETLRIAVDLVQQGPLTEYNTSIAIVDTSIAVLFLSLSLLAVLWLRPAYWLYAISACLLALSSSVAPDAYLPTASLGRYMLAVFPAFIVLGIAGRNRLVHHFLIGASAIMLGPLALYFFSRIWVA